jgi:anti-sigma B factor antagonist
MAIDGPLSIEVKEGKNSGTRIVTLVGPITLRNLFEFQDVLRAGELPRLAILDLSGVPYMDSSGMGAVINYYVFCQRHNTKMIAAGVSPRVMELFKMTKVDSVIPLAGSVDEAQAGA